MQHWLAGQAYIFCCCTIFFFFDNQTYRWESAQQAPADTISTLVPQAELIKYPQTFEPSCPLFTGGKCQKKFGPNIDPNRLWTAIFLKIGALSEIQNKLVKDRWQVYHHTNLGIGRSPKLSEPLAKWVPKRVKVKNFLYIFCSCGPRPAGARRYYTSSGPPGSTHKLSRHLNS